MLEEASAVRATYPVVLGSDRTPEGLDPPLVRPGAAAYPLTVLTLLAALAAALPSLLAPELLDGPAVTQGNLRGTALVVLLGGLPTVLLGMAGTARGSARALVAWAGGLAYLLYQGVLFCFATPMNSLFLAYVALLGLAIYSVIALARAVEVGAFDQRVSESTPTRLVPVVLAAVGVLNALGWLARIVPASLSSDPVDVLDGSGMISNPVWVQDLAFWIPLALVGAVWMWRRRPEGILLAVAMVAFYVLESVSVAVDQAWGAHADPTRPEIASTAVVAPMLVAAALLLVLLGLALRALDQGRATRSASRSGATTQ